jgi:hypothetical protein
LSSVPVLRLNDVADGCDPHAMELDGRCGEHVQARDGAAVTVVGVALVVPETCEVGVLPSSCGGVQHHHQQDDDDKQQEEEEEKEKEEEEEEKEEEEMK